MFATNVNLIPINLAIALLHHYGVRPFILIKSVTSRVQIMKWWRIHSCGSHTSNWLMFVKLEQFEWKWLFSHSLCIFFSQGIYERQYDHWENEWYWIFKLWVKSANFIESLKFRLKVGYVIAVLTWQKINCLFLAAIWCWENLIHFNRCSLSQ